MAVFFSVTCIAWESLYKEKLLTLFKIAEKSAGLESCDTVAEEEWPEIENMFPFDPQGKNYWCNYESLTVHFHKC